MSDKLVTMDINDPKLYEKLIELFIEDSSAIVMIDDKKRITYESFIMHILTNSDILYSKDKVERHQRRNKENEQFEWKTTKIDYDRFKMLYFHNDKIINYLRYINPYKIYVMVSLDKKICDYMNIIFQLLRSRSNNYFIRLLKERNE